MQAVVLAAGRSTRTYPLTSTRPKPLVPLWDRPLIGQQLRQLSGLVDEVLVVVGYRREQIEEALGSVYAGTPIRYVMQERQRGTADALLAARPHVEAPTLVINGDDFYHRNDLAALGAGGRGLLVTQASDPWNRAVVRIENERVVDIVEKPADARPSAWCSVGGYCLEASDYALLDDLPKSPRGELELPDFILRLVHRHGVRPRRIQETWMPITYAWDVLGTILDVWREPQRAASCGFSAEPHEALRARKDIAWGRRVAMEGPVVIPPRVTIGDGSRLVGPLVLGAGTTLDAGASVERTVTFEGVRIGRRTRIADSVIGANVRVGDGALVETRPGASLEIEVRGKKVIPEIEALGAVVGDGASIAEGANVPAGSLIPPRDVAETP